MRRDGGDGLNWLRQVRSGQESSWLSWNSAGGPGKCFGCLKWYGRL